MIFFTLFFPPLFFHFSKKDVDWVALDAAALVRAYVRFRRPRVCWENRGILHGVSFFYLQVLSINSQSLYKGYKGYKQQRNLFVGAVVPATQDQDVHRFPERCFPFRRGLTSSPEQQHNTTPTATPWPKWLFQHRHHLPPLPPTSVRLITGR